MTAGVLLRAPTIIGPDGKAIPDQSIIGFLQRSKIFTEAWAVFGEVNYDITDRWHLIAGIRYNDEEKHGEGDVVPRFPITGDVSDDAWTPRVALRYDITDGTNVYASITKGFKAAVLSSFEQTDNLSEPEEIIAYEFGVKGAGQNYRYGVAAFYYDYTDLQSQVWDGSASILDNAEDAEIFGIEVDASFNVTEEFLVRATASWLDTEYGNFVSTAFELPNSPGGMAQNNDVDVTGNQMIIAPEWSASLTLSYATEIAWGEIEANGHVVYNDDLWFDFLERVKQDGYTLLNAC
jgi:iron complex outermembrane receptor protein